MIRAEHVSKQFDGRMVLDDVTATFETGKTNLIIGQSGSGKTVFLKSLVGLHQIDGGHIYYDDICYSSLNFKEKKDVRKQVGMLFQGGALFDYFTVEENVKFPLDIFTDLAESDKLDIVNETLKRVRIDNATSSIPPR